MGNQTSRPVTFSLLELDWTLVVQLSMMYSPPLGGWPFRLEPS